MRHVAKVKKRHGTFLKKNCAIFVGDESCRFRHTAWDKRGLLQVQKPERVGEA